MGCSGSKPKEPAKEGQSDKTLLQSPQSPDADKVAGDNKATAATAKNVLIIATSANAVGDHKTGAWSEEICGPFYTFQDAGYVAVVCSIDGGDVPIDAGSLSDQFKTENDKRMIESGCGPLKGTLALRDVDVSAFDVLFFAGGHGACVDFPTDAVGNIVSKAFATDKVVAAVCHGLTALVKATTADGEPLVNGKHICCFTDAEEEMVGLTQKVPFLVETKMKELGAIVETAAPWTDKSMNDGLLVTGQNPQSSISCAKLAIATAMASGAVEVDMMARSSMQTQAGDLQPAKFTQDAEETPQIDPGMVGGTLSVSSMAVQPSLTEVEGKTFVCC